MCKVYGAGQIRDRISNTYTFLVDIGIEGGGGCVKKGKNRSGWVKEEIFVIKSQLL